MSSSDYEEGEVVWVKLNNSWWPGQICDEDSVPDDLLDGLKKKPFAIVKFFNEDQFECVTNARSIFPYHCKRKMEFIKKGLELYRSNNKFMEKFPSDVQTAERLTNGDVNIIDTVNPASTQKATAKNSRSTRSVGSSGGSNSRTQKPQTSSTEDTPRKVVVSSNHTVTTFLDITSPRTSESSPAKGWTSGSNFGTHTYKCRLCEFSSTRMNIYIIHCRIHQNYERPYDTHDPRSCEPVKNKMHELSKTEEIKEKNNEPITANKKRDEPEKEKEPHGLDDEEEPHELEKSVEPDEPTVPKSKVVDDVIIIDDDDDSQDSAVEPVRSPPTPPKPRGRKSAHRKLKKSFRDIPSPPPAQPTTDPNVCPKGILKAKKSGHESPAKQDQPTATVVVPDTATNNKRKGNEKKSLKTLSPAKRKAQEEIKKRFLADWSDVEAEDQGQTQADNSLSSAISIESATLATERRFDSQVLNILRSSQGMRSSINDETVATPTTITSSDTVSQPKIRNIPKKDRRDIILKEFGNDAVESANSSISNDRVDEGAKINTTVALEKSQQKEDLPPVVEQQRAEKPQADAEPQPVAVQQSVVELQPVNAQQIIEDPQQTVKKSQQPMEKALQSVEKAQTPVEKTQQPMEKELQPAEKAQKTVEKSQQSVEKSQQPMENALQPVEKAQKLVDKSQQIKERKPIEISNMQELKPMEVEEQLEEPQPGDKQPNDEPQKAKEPQPGGEPQPNDEPQKVIEPQPGNELQPIEKSLSVEGLQPLEEPHVLKDPQEIEELRQVKEREPIEILRVEELNQLAVVLQEVRSQSVEEAPRDKEQQDDEDEEVSQEKCLQLVEGAPQEENSQHALQSAQEIDSEKMEKSVQGDCQQHDGKVSQEENSQLTLESPKELVIPQVEESPEILQPLEDPQEVVSQHLKAPQEIVSQHLKAPQEVVSQTLEVPPVVVPQVLESPQEKDSIQEETFQAMTVESDTDEGVHQIQTPPQNIEVATLKAESPIEHDSLASTKPQPQDQQTEAIEEPQQAVEEHSSPMPSKTSEQKDATELSQPHPAEAESQKQSAAKISCFDFQDDEEDESDVLASISKFKKKYFSPEKNRDDSQKAQQTPKENVELEKRDKELTAEIESLLTTDSPIKVPEIPKIDQQSSTPSTQSLDCSISSQEVRTLPIKERGKRIFKSRNRSRNEDTSDARKSIDSADQSSKKVSEIRSAGRSSRKLSLDESRPRGIARNIRKMSIDHLGGLRKAVRPLTGDEFILSGIDEIDKISSISHNQVPHAEQIPEEKHIGTDYREGQAIVNSIEQNVSEVYAAENLRWALENEKSTEVDLEDHTSVANLQNEPEEHGFEESEKENGFVDENSCRQSDKDVQVNEGSLEIPANFESRGEFSEVTPEANEQPQHAINENIETHEVTLKTAIPNEFTESETRKEDNLTDAIEAILSISNSQNGRQIEEQSTQVEAEEEKDEIEQAVPIEKEVETEKGATMSRKRRAHLKQSPRKRLHTEPVKIELSPNPPVEPNVETTKTKSRTPRKAAGKQNSPQISPSSRELRSRKPVSQPAPESTVSIPQKDAPISPAKNSTGSDLPKSEKPTNRLSEIRSFRPQRRMTMCLTEEARALTETEHQFVAEASATKSPQSTEVVELSEISLIKMVNKKQKSEEPCSSRKRQKTEAGQSAIIEKVVSPRSDMEALGSPSSVTVASPQPQAQQSQQSTVEKVQITVDVANPLCSQIADILAANSRQVVHDPRLPKKRKQTLEDDIPSFVIERPARMSTDEPESHEIEQLSKPTPPRVAPPMKTLKLDELGKITTKVASVVQQAKAKQSHQLQNIVQPSKSSPTPCSSTITTFEGQTQTPVRQFIVNPVNNKAAAEALYDVSTLPMNYTSEIIQQDENVHLIITPKTVPPPAKHQLPQQQQILTNVVPVPQAKKTANIRTKRAPSRPQMQPATQLIMQSAGSSDKSQVLNKPVGIDRHGNKYILLKSGDSMNMVKRPATPIETAVSCKKGKTNVTLTPFSGARSQVLHNNAIGTQQLLITPPLTTATSCSSGLTITPLFSTASTTSIPAKRAGNDQGFLQTIQSSIQPQPNNSMKETAVPKQQKYVRQSRKKPVVMTPIPAPTPPPPQISQTILIPAQPQSTASKRRGRPPKSTPVKTKQFPAAISPVALAPVISEERLIDSSPSTSLHASESQSKTPAQNRKGTLAVQAQERNPTPPCQPIPSTSEASPPQDDSQIDENVSTKILAVPAKPIAGYTDAFLLCTMINNKYEPIDNKPMYLNHELNQLVPIPAEVLCGQTTTISITSPNGMTEVESINAAFENKQAQNEMDSHQQMFGGNDQIAESNHQQIQEDYQNEQEMANVIAEQQQQLQQMEITEETNVDQQITDASQLQSSVVLTIDGHQIVLDQQSFLSLIANGSEAQELITSEGQRIVLTPEVIAELEQSLIAEEESVLAAEESQQIILQGDFNNGSNILSTNIGAAEVYTNEGYQLSPVEMLQIETSNSIILTPAAGQDGVIFQPITPPITAQTNETHALLETPIMSTLEVPSNNKKKSKFVDSLVVGESGEITNLEDSLAVIGVTTQSSSSVPSSLELPITVTNPAIASKANPISLSTIYTTGLTSHPPQMSPQLTSMNHEQELQYELFTSSSEHAKSHQSYNIRTTTLATGDDSEQLNEFAGNASISGTTYDDAR